MLFTEEKREALKLRAKPGIKKLADRVFKHFYPFAMETNIDDLFEQLITVNAIILNKLDAEDMPEEFDENIIGQIRLMYLAMISQHTQEQAVPVLGKSDFKSTEEKQPVAPSKEIPIAPVDKEKVKKMVDDAHLSKLNSINTNEDLPINEDPISPEEMEEYKKLKGANAQQLLS